MMLPETKNKSICMQLVVFILTPFLDRLPDDSTQSFARAGLNNSGIYARAPCGRHIDPFSLNHQYTGDPRSSPIGSLV